MKQNLEPTQLAAHVAGILGAATPEQLPRAIGVKELSFITGLTKQAILLYMCTPKYRHLAPPNAFKLPGSNQWRWWLHEVLEWMKSGQRAKAAPRPRGRPPGSTSRAMRARREAERGAAAGVKG